MMVGWEQTVRESNKQQRYCSTHSTQFVVLLMNVDTAKNFIVQLEHPSSDNTLQGPD